MRYGYLSVLLLLVAIYRAEASRYDDPSFLISHLVSGGVSKDGIPALTNPTFVEPDEVNYLAEDDVVMGLVINGEPRAYPHNIGWWNEIINDRVGDQSVVVSLCPLTGTGQVFNATDGDGSQIEFGGLRAADQQQLGHVRSARRRNALPADDLHGHQRRPGRRPPRTDACGGDDLGTLATDVPKHHRGTSHYGLGVL